MLDLDGELLKHLLPPWTDADTRLLLIDASSAGDGYQEFLLPNPWLDAFSRGSDVFRDAEKLAVLGVPTSLARGLRGSIPAILQRNALGILSSLVESSACACVQLVEGKLLPLLIWECQGGCADLKVAAQKIERRCIEAWNEVAYSRGFAPRDDWLGWPPTYDICLKLRPLDTMWVHLAGVQRSMSLFDMNGVHLTGGRLWAGALVLTRWLASVHAASTHQLGHGLVLELGAGLGLCGLVLAKLGYKVALSDREPSLLEAMRENIQINAAADTCRALRLDWAKAENPKVGQLLQRQGFSTVIGSDLVYETGQGEVLVSVLKRALAQGGRAFLAQAQHHRYCQDEFCDALARAGLPFERRVVATAGVLQTSFCGSWEPDQEYALYSVEVPRPCGAV
jgi:predicted nicotinamide N-methyase